MLAELLLTSRHVMFLCWVAGEPQDQPMNCGSTRPCSTRSGRSYNLRAEASGLAAAADIEGANPVGPRDIPAVPPGRTEQDAVAGECGVLTDRYGNWAYSG